MTNLEKIEGTCLGFCPSCPYLKNNPSIDVEFCQKVNTLRKITRVENLLTIMFEKQQSPEEEVSKQFVSEEIVSN